jgi:hypothetical protein
MLGLLAGMPALDVSEEDKKSRRQDKKKRGFFSFKS